MKEMRFEIEINATREKVWDTLWQDETLRQWSGIIDPGTHLAGDMKEGNEIQFISGNGYGVSSLVEKLKPAEFVLLRHSADTQNNGLREREKQWTGGSESYSLAEQNGVTTLTFSSDVPPELEEYFKNAYPKAMEKIKELAERKN